MWKSTTTPGHLLPDRCPDGASLSRNGLALTRWRPTLRRVQSILVIDDQADLRFAVEFALTRAGYAVTAVGNWPDALAALQKTKPDLVITDVIMPGKDDIEVIMELRKSHPTLPVAVMSGGGQLVSDVYLKMARSFGVKGILQKPFSNEQLLAVVTQALPPPQA
jgi:DNA-binding NtrC family response regulator